MAPVTLRLKEASLEAPLEAGCITPDGFLTKSQSEIGALPVSYGGVERRLADFFEVEGERAEEVLVEGDLSRVQGIGQGMSWGRIIIRGSVGGHVGAFMRGGIILVEGSAGHEAGAAMQRGLLVVTGDVQDFAGAQMRAGTILVFGRAGLQTGRGMKGGTIVAFHPVELLPTFEYNCTYAPIFLRVFFKALRRLGVEVKPEYYSGLYQRYHGDLADLGKGEILIIEA